MNDIGTRARAAAGLFAALAIALTLVTLRAERLQSQIDVLRSATAPANAIWLDTAFDRFTTDLMTNHEVLDVNQDVLGEAGARVFQDERLEVWAKPLADGTRAVALFNRGLSAAPVTARWADIGASGRQPVRDLWQQRDLGMFEDGFTVDVPAHGAVLVRVGRAR